ncbi:hypothetical protein PLAN_40782 [Planktothrix rubescens CCAP 1459/22]|uniref:Uncharacterized protein n=1 Tax=Planktothrix rubescens CCAP 1459/22 TaxID=329571 RepID=A0A6J7ZP93_PLARU|nr:hypothetical protein PLAN_40782 [Planktothrix rubescens NIVA-CYA 18]
MPPTSPHFHSIKSNFVQKYMKLYENAVKCELQYKKSRIYQTR